MRTSCVEVVQQSVEVLFASNLNDFMLAYHALLKSILVDRRKDVLDNILKSRRVI